MTRRPTRWAVAGLAVAAFLLPTAPDAAAGQVFAWGTATTGQPDTPEVLSPRRIDGANLAGRDVVQIAGGGKFGLLRTRDGGAFVYGFGVADQAGFPDGFFSPTAVPVAAPGLSGKIVSVEAGIRQTLLLDSEGVVHTFASVGRLDYSDTAAPLDATHLNGERIVDIAGGYRFSLLLSEGGDVYSFGDTPGIGALGRTSNPRSGFGPYVAAPIDGTKLAGETVVQIAAGDYYGLVLTEDGSLYKFGRQSGGESPIPIPEEIKLIATELDLSGLGDERVVEVAAGGAHTLLLTNAGNVFSFGANSSGQTGQGADADSSLEVRPIDATSLGGRKVEKIAAGYVHSLLLADDGSVFQFGMNQRGPITYDVPTLVDLSNLGGLRVVDIAAGDYHSLLLAVPEPSGLMLVGGGLLVGRRRVREWRAPR